MRWILPVLLALTCFAIPSTVRGQQPPAPGVNDLYRACANFHKFPKVEGKGYVDPVDLDLADKKRLAGCAEKAQDEAYAKWVDKALAAEIKQGDVHSPLVARKDARPPPFADVEALYKECAARYRFPESLDRSDLDLIRKSQVIACAEKSRDIPFATWANHEFAEEIRTNKMARAWFDGLDQARAYTPPWTKPVTRQPPANGLPVLVIGSMLLGTCFVFLVVGRKVVTGRDVAWGPAILAIAGMLSLALSAFGLGTPAGNKAFDEMSGMIPFFAGVFGGIASLIAIAWGIARNAGGRDP